MRKELVCLASLIVFGIGVVSVWSFRDSRTAATSNETEPQARSQEQTSARPEHRASTESGVDKTAVSRSNAIPQRLTTALEAETALELWTLLRNSDSSNTGLITILQNLVGACGQAKKLNAQVGSLEGGQKENALAAGVFLGYCVGFDQVEPEIAADIQRRRLLMKPKLDDMAVLGIAAPKNKQATSVLLDEIKSSNNPYIAREMAMVVSDLARPGFPLESWSKLLPPSASRGERAQVFGLAAEMVYCANHAACQPTSLLSNQICLYEQRCVRGEDLLSYRRRTTAPIVYQSAQFVADEIRRHKIEP
jgi:hypothetical protein